jgi:outer membrane protein assembly factor BamB
MDAGVRDASQSGSGGSSGAGKGGSSGSVSGAGGKSGVSGGGAGGRAGSGGQAGAAASGGRSGSGGAAGDGEPPIDTSASVLERNKHPSRDGHFLQPMLTKANVESFASDTDFAANFDGNMWASPLYLEDGPGDKGLFFAVTTGNDVYALDETTGTEVWKRNLGDSPQMNGVGCGNIHPLGILSTPVIDAEARTIFVAGALGTDAIARHELHALSVDTGESRPSWPVNVSALQAGSLSFNSPPQNQRSALSLVQGVVYVAYGGHIGDCGDYHGWVVGVDSKDPSKRGAWATLGRGEAIWAAGGMASDGTSIFAVTGNSTTGVSSRSNSDSEEVVRLSGLAEFERNDQNLYYPASWRTMDDVDADFGASNPIYMRIPGSSPEYYVLAIAKDGHLYLLKPDDLGGMGGHVVDFQVSNGNMSVRTVPAVYTTNQGVYVVFSTLTGGRCPDGTASGARIVAVRFGAGSPPTAEVAWCAGFSGGETSPIATTTDGKSNPTVWFIDSDELRALDGDSGETIYTSSETCSGVRKWTSPIAVKGRIVAGGDDHLCSWSAH